MVHTQYWSMSDEELLHAAYGDDTAPPLVTELAIRLERYVDYELEDDGEYVAAEPVWKKAIG